MAKSFLFYDIESSGQSTSCDQIYTLAMIKTDEGLNEQWRREVVVQPVIDIVPTPEAILVHRLTPQRLLSGENEWQAMQDIHQCFNTPNTLSVGYNNLSFDDEMLRFSFDRNLLPPYTHQYAQGCHRLDVFPLVVMYYLFQHEVLHWPQRQDVVSFKLEDMAISNGFIHEQAHDAMSDVVATVQLVQKMMTAQDFFQYVVQYYNKHIDQQRIHQCLQSGQVVLMVDVKFGKARSMINACLFLGYHQVYRNQSLWLCLDDEQLSEQEADTIRVYRKKMGEPGFVLPYSRYQEKLSEQRQQVIEHNIAWLQDHEATVAQWSKYAKNKCYEAIEDLELDASLYSQGFPQESALAAYAQFVKDPCMEHLQQITDPQKKQQAWRILKRHFPERLQEAVDFEGALRHGGRDHRGRAVLTRGEDQSWTGAWQHHSAEDQALLKQWQVFLASRDGS